MEGCHRDAIALWDEVPEQTALEWGLREGILHLRVGDQAAAERAFRAAEVWARAEQAKSPEGVPDDHVGRRWALLQSMLGRHAAAMAMIDGIHQRHPETRNASFGASVSLSRSVILVRAGRTDEGHAEFQRLLRLRFGYLGDVRALDPLRALLETDPRCDGLINRPPRL